MKNLVLAAPLLFIFVVGCPGASYAFGIGGVSIGPGPSIGGMADTPGVSGTAARDGSSVQGQAVDDAQHSASVTGTDPAESKPTEVQEGGVVVSVPSDPSQVTGPLASGARDVVSAIASIQESL